MATITVQPDLAQDLEQLATRRQSQVEEIVATALRRYIRQAQEEKMKEEATTFCEMHAELVAQYDGEVVAIHEGQVVDHDKDFVALHRRIRQRFGRAAVLLRRVSSEPERVLAFRSPRLERDER